MKISDADLDDFIRSWQSAFDERLTRDEAHRELTKLLELMKVLARPLPSKGKPMPEGPWLDTREPGAL